MSDQSAANAIRREPGWTKREAITFVRRNKGEAFEHARDNNISTKEALIRLARQYGKLYRPKPPVIEVKGDQE